MAILPNGRMLVGLNAATTDDQLMRYAAMVARASQPVEPTPGQAAAHYAPRRASPGGTGAVQTVTGRKPINRRFAVCRMPEIRFVAAQPSACGADEAIRAELADKVARHFHAPQFSRTSFDLLKGRAFQRLPALAHDFASDLLLLDDSTGTRRQCAQLAVSAACPVWLLPAGWAPVLRRILVPVDFSTTAAANLRTAVELARHFQPAKIIALYCEPLRSRFGTDAVAPRRQRELAEAFEGFMRLMGACDVRIEPLFVQGNHLGRTLARVARQQAIDLTVVSARRRSRLASAMRPSQAEDAILHAAGPVLVLNSLEKRLGLLNAFKERCRDADAPLFS
jgi:nucleotide-binding universal stress UspA family protein